MNDAPEKSIVIKSGDNNRTVLEKYEALKEAGLEVKPETRMKPRLIIHDLPVSLEPEQIKECIIKQNELTDEMKNNLGFIFIYPKRN